MKKIVLSMLLINGSFAYGTDFKITLTPNFLKFDGVYKFSMDVEGKAIDKEWEVTVQKGKATVKGAKGVKGNKISINNNVISVKAGIMKKKEADELEVLVKKSDFFGVDTTTKTGLAKDSKKFTVDVGPGIGLFLAMADKAKVGKDCSYTVTGTDLPDGQYTFKLIIPAAKDMVYKFEVIDGKIAKLLKGSDKTGHLMAGYLEINANSMCAKRRSKMAAVGAAIAIPVAVGTAALTVATGGTDLIAILPGISAWGAAMTATAVAGAASGALTGTQMGKTFGNREATAQLTYDSGPWQGDKAAKFEYAECRNNVFVVYKSDQKINIMGEK